MTRIPYPICALTALVLVAAMGLAPAGPSQALGPVQAGALREFSTFEDVLGAGQGSLHVKEDYEILSTDPLHPVGWLYVTDSTADGDGTEYLITTSDYVIPGPLATSVQRTTHMLPSVSATSLEEFLDWIVLAYDHVDATEDLEVFRRDVSPVLP